VWRYTWVWAGIFRWSFSIKWAGWKGHLLLSIGLFRLAAETQIGSNLCLEPFRLLETLHHGMNSTDIQAWLIWTIVTEVPKFFQKKSNENRTHFKIIKKLRKSWKQKLYLKSHYNHIHFLYVALSRFYVNSNFINMAM
jgi:hypothetical protein